MKTYKKDMGFKGIYLEISKEVKFKLDRKLKKKKKLDRKPKFQFFLRVSRHKFKKIKR